VRLAYQFALESDLVRADGIEATEFADLASQYRVYSVPKTVINGEAYVEGALPEAFFLDAILKKLEPAEGSQTVPTEDENR